MPLRTNPNGFAGIADQGDRREKRRNETYYDLHWRVSYQTRAPKVNEKML